ncbi:N-acetyltransferase domain-containing protein OS=Tsukamurella paurometabola (strain ATCC 8368 / DSM / CCUG 35730 / CIP 100753 / JCM 10117 / KCTC 9821 /NBRC 16120 / NCIMB 702349 / NCTC 13040) OX=521096 GN=Tpau_1179 PE=4 SV=1 [Tsukamurella paurometabola]|uniref:N-acetyltransferase domain-containing protein n=1 Tax=Tsukamurella paurometabola (strain ATCC 8368 / DSM 20162 / CCUG 35730 / CIP 100753 / JCM 10117 / KCTC 9821 / NBRC 16120 / NCIMB 702349 / NCTC 13040) TaxID=521096 RepID=D5UW03_TSUPD|nr:GNAT family protein [Tsukamurella paurometabola]ADG77810.1 hypothetical protein Tpau_1179 [Tsukamurella paurometabola DSM 20162]SUP28841.1 Uncharacterised protein [Tsukamurella paurometabola]
MKLPIAVPSAGDRVQVSALSRREDLFAALDHAAVWQHIPGGAPETPEVMAERLSGAGRQPLLIDHTGTVLGTSSYLLDPADPGGIEIGATLLTPDAWGTGINSAAKALMIDAAFAAGAQWVQFRTDERNGRSAAAILKLPGAVEIASRREPHIVRSDGTVRTSRVFRIPLRPA